MCLEESFCPFTRDALNFRQPKIYAAPHRPAVFRFALFLTVITALRDSPLFHSAQLPPMLTRKAESAQIMRRQVRSMSLVYLFLFAVALMC